MLSRLVVEAIQMRVPLAEVGNRFICAKTLSKMCCLSEASSHFVVFVCVNPDRERLPSIESPKQKFVDSSIYYRFRMIKVELVPPKPNELDKKVSNCVSTRSVGIFNLAESSSGFSKLTLGAIKPFFIIIIE